MFLVVKLQGYIFCVTIHVAGFHWVILKYAITLNHLQPPTTTHKYPQPSTITRNYPQSPTTTQPSTTHNNLRNGVFKQIS